MRRSKMRPLFLSLAAAAVLALPATRALAGACGGGPINTPDAVAQHVITDLNAGDLSFIANVEPADVRVQTAPVALLASAWQGYVAQFGPLVAQGQPTVESQPPVQNQAQQTVVDVPVQFTSGQGTVQITFNYEMTIRSLSFQPSEPQGQ
jgi:hypothetical protein